MTDSLEQQFAQQHFTNAYEFVNGVQMHAENGEQFQIPHSVLKKHVGVGHFVELRIDSPRFSVHDDAVEKCYCPTCNGEATKPILGHEHPATLLPLPQQNVPSRGWGEDFWVQVMERSGKFFKGVVDNPLYEARLHEVNQGDSVYFSEDHILAVHGSHRQDMVLGMDAADLKESRSGLGHKGNDDVSGLNITILPETAADHNAIRQVNRLAFGQDAEAQLVDALREGGFVRLSLVAKLDGQVIGHILFSDTQIVSNADSVDALALAPMAVIPQQQRQGIGSDLIQTSLEQCRQSGHRIVIVVGHPSYYPRFGFSPELAAPLQSKYAGEAFMALELVPGALNGVTGEVKYAPPFEAF